ncbi:putative cobalt ABC transporter permease protein [Anaerolinea thermophila UNI-1]|uniref:Cobalt ABC transporter permease protein n=2 Tax=Anaerolinea thermophila TaxID=167964 RepID=E8MYH2_ANATU|nr:putative cobalt ABC transporter permease protein [Anaerolinea thermophila UNI-1]
MLVCRGGAMSVILFQSTGRRTLFHRLDFRSKAVLMLAVTVTAFIWEDPLAQAGLALAVFLACVLGGVRWAYLRVIFLLMTPLFILLMLTHGFFNVQQVRSLLGGAPLTYLLRFPEDWWLIGGGGLTREGLLYGLNAVLKTLSVVMIVPLVIFTSDVDQVVVGMVRARVPYTLAFIFSATLRFFPLLFAEAQTIIEAQRLRGLAVERLRPWERVQVYARIAVPLILGALVRSQQLEVVLQSRAFSGSPQRTFLHESRLSPADWAVMALALGGMALAVVLRLTTGFGSFHG